MNIRPSIQAALEKLILDRLRFRKARLARLQWRLESATGAELYPLGGGDKHRAFEAIKLQTWY